MAGNVEQRMTADAVTDLYTVFEEKGLHVWVDGGWAVDALLGEETRLHGDLDVAVLASDMPTLRALMLERGYVEKGEPFARPWNYVLRDEAGHEVDLHIIELDDEGNGVLGPPENGDVYPAHSLTGSGTIKGRAVRCIAVEDLIAFHSGYELDQDDCADVTALCRRFGFAVPSEVEAAIARLGLTGIRPTPGPEVGPHL